MTLLESFWTCIIILIVLEFNLPYKWETQHCIKCIYIYFFLLLFAKKSMCIYFLHFLATDTRDLWCYFAFKIFFVCVFFFFINIINNNEASIQELKRCVEESKRESENKNCFIISTAMWICVRQKKSAANDFKALEIWKKSSSIWIYVFCCFQCFFSQQQQVSELNKFSPTRLCISTCFFFFIIFPSSVFFFFIFLLFCLVCLASCVIPYMYFDLASCF